MTLEELQAEFPHGSRWLAGPEDTPFTVCGWTPEQPPGIPDSHGDYPRVEGGYHAPHGVYRNSWQPSDLSQLPVPCPITEPTTIRRSVTADHLWCTGACGIDRITLHPAEPGATEGRYTWDSAT